MEIIFIFGNFHGVQRFFQTFWRLKENWCAFKFLTSGLGLGGMSFRFVAMFSPCRGLSNCWKFMAIPPNG